MDQYSSALAQDTLPSHRRKRRRMLVALLLASSLATVGAGAMSLAVFTDSKASSGSWTTGTIVLGVSPSTAFTATGIMPGDTGTQIVDVKNNGTSQLRYAMSTAISGDTKGLAGQMQLVITDGAVSGGVCTGNVLNTSSLSGAKLGSNAQGAQTGDRSVDAGLTDSLCFQWTFPKSSDDTFQGAATSATFTFDAEQTANN
jgi:hypothetical protein